MSSKKKYPKDKSVLPDQSALVQKLYKEWDYLAVEIESLNKLIKSSSFKKYPLKKRICLKRKRKYMKKGFKCVDKQILIEVLGDKA